MVVKDLKYRLLLATLVTIVMVTTVLLMACVVPPPTPETPAPTPAPGPVPSAIPTATPTPSLTLTPTPTPPKIPETAQQQASQSTDTAHMDVFDAHAHIDKNITASQVISEMDAAGVSMVNLYPDNDSRSLEAISQYPNRFVTFVGTPDRPHPSAWLK